MAQHDIQTTPVPGTTGTIVGRRSAAAAATQKSVNAVRQKRRKLIFAMGCVLLAAVAFFGGFLIRGDTKLMERLGIPTGIIEEEVNPGMTVQGSTYVSISARMAEIEGILLKYSLDSYDLDELTAALTKSFVETTADPYLRYYSQERYETYVRESVTGNYAGIGVLFGEYQGQAYVVDVFEGGVAQASGIAVGDFVVAVNGDSSQDWTATEVQNAIGMADGGSIVITWRRPPALSTSGGEEFTTTLSCTATPAPNVQFEIDGDVGYITVTQFTHNVASLVRDAVVKLTNEGAEAFVLDLRDCSGGYLTQAVELADLFMKSGIIMQIETKDATTTKNATGSQLTEKPLIVLVNGNTSAAAEVVVAALHDAKRATIVGTRTMGKGSVQVIRELSFGGALRYTAAYYKSPLGLSIEGSGITPDITVTDARQQKIVAVETAQGMVPAKVTTPEEGNGEANAA